MIFVSDFEGSSVLHAASQLGSVEVTRLLLRVTRKFGLNADVTDASGMTPLHHACANGHKELAQLLISTGNASTERCDDVYFRNARDWFEASGGSADWMSEEQEPRSSFDAEKLQRVLNAKERLAEQQRQETLARLEACKTAPVASKRHTAKLTKRSSLNKSLAVSSTRVEVQVEEIKDGKNASSNATGAGEVVYVSEMMRRGASDASLRTRSAPNVDVKRARVTSASSLATCTSRSSASHLRHASTVTSSTSTSQMSGDVTSSASCDVMPRARHELNCSVCHSTEVRCSCSRSTRSFFSSPTFTELYRLYTEQCSPAFQPSAQPSIPQPELSAQSRRKRTSAKSLSSSRSSSGSAKARLQRIVRMRRGELSRAHVTSERRRESRTESIHDVTSGSDESPRSARKRRESCVTLGHKNDGRSVAARRRSEV